MGAISSPEYYNLRTNSPLNCKGFPTAWRNIIPYFEHYVSKNGPQKEAEIKSLYYTSTFKAIQEKCAW